MKSTFSKISFFIFGAASIMNVFYYPYLTQGVGLSLSDVGTVVSIGSFFTIFAQPYISNKLSNMKDKKKFILIFLFSVILSIFALTQVKGKIAYLFAPIYGIVIASLIVVFEIYVEYLCSSAKLEFAIIRKWGSIGFALLVLLGGIIINNFGFFILYCTAIVLVLTVWILIKFKVPNYTSEGVHSKVKLFDLIKNKKVAILALVVFLGYGSYYGSDYTVSSYIVELSNNVDTGNLIYSISNSTRVILEFITFILVAKYFNDIKSNVALRISFIAATTRILLFSTGILPLVIIGDQLHGVFMAFYLSFVFKYIRSIVKENEVASTFTILSVLVFGISSFIYPNIYSLIQSNLGYITMYLTVVGIMIVSIACTFLLQKDKSSLS